MVIRGEREGLPVDDPLGAAADRSICRDVAFQASRVSPVPLGMEPVQSATLEKQAVTVTVHLNSVAFVKAVCDEASLHRTETVLVRNASELR